MKAKTVLKKSTAHSSRQSKQPQIIRLPYGRSWSSSVPRSNVTSALICLARMYGHCHWSVPHTRMKFYSLVVTMRQTAAPGMPIRTSV